MFDLLVIALLCLLVVKGKRAIVAYEHRAQRWRDADAGERERIVREECAWRVIGRSVGATGIGIAAFCVASPGLALMCALVAWRVVKPIRAELRDACSYHSTGAGDEPRYHG